MNNMSTLMVSIVPFGASTFAAALTKPALVWYYEARTTKKVGVAGHAASVWLILLTVLR